MVLQMAVIYKTVYMYFCEGISWKCASIQKFSSIWVHTITYAPEHTAELITTTTCLKQIKNNLVLHSACCVNQFKAGCSGEDLSYICIVLLELDGKVWVPKYVCYSQQWKYVGKIIMFSLQIVLVVRIISCCFTYEI